MTIGDNMHLDAQVSRYVRIKDGWKAEGQCQCGKTHSANGRTKEAAGIGFSKQVQSCPCHNQTSTVAEPALVATLS